MPKISSEALQWLLQQTPKPTLTEIVRGSGQALASILRGGFRLESKTFENKRTLKRLSDMLQDQPEALEIFLIDAYLMRCWRKAYAAIEIIDKEWLKKNWRELLRSVSDPRPLVLGMYWISISTEDEKLKYLSQWLFACPSLWKEPTLAKRDAFLSAALSHLTVSSKGASGHSAIDAEKMAALRQKLEQEQSSSRKLLDQSRRESKLQQQTHETEMQQWRQKYAELERELKEREKHWQRQYQQLEDNAKEFANGKIAAFEQLVFGLQPGQAEQLASIRDDNLSLCERVEKALRLQSAHNRRFGLRQELRQEVALLENRLQDIQQAIDECLVVHDDLPNLQSELEARIFHLKEQLGDDTVSLSSVDIPRRMKTMIKTVRLDDMAPQIFTEIRQFLEHEYIHRLLQPKEIQSIRNLLDEQKKNHEHIISSREAASAQKKIGEIWFLEQHIQDFHRTSVYIDGCNLILCDPYWKELTEKKGQAAAREEVIAKCNSKAALFKMFHLVFDGIGGQDSIEKRNEHLTVHFAGKKESEQNADNYLVDLLKKTSQDAQELRWVVTQDFGLQKRVEQLCNAIVLNQKLAKFLREH